MNFIEALQALKDGKIIRPHAHKFPFFAHEWSGVLFQQSNREEVLPMLSIQDYETEGWEAAKEV